MVILEERLFAARHAAFDECQFAVGLLKGQIVAASMGDLTAFSKLVEEHRARLLAMLKDRMPASLRNRIDPEDVLHEALIAAQRRFADFRRSSTLTPYAWLFRLALDALISAWHHEHRQKRAADREIPWPDHTSVQLAEGIIAKGTTPSAKLVRDELAEHIHRAMQSLKPAEREILWLRHFACLTFPEAASVLDITENAATVRYVRALRRLRVIWREMGLLADGSVPAAQADLKHQGRQGGQP